MFQSLIGRLKTRYPLQISGTYKWFQSLIGRLKTRSAGLLRPGVATVSIPYR